MNAAMGPGFSPALQASRAVARGAVVGVVFAGVVSCGVAYGIAMRQAGAEQAARVTAAATLIAPGPVSPVGAMTYAEATRTFLARWRSDQTDLPGAQSTGWVAAPPAARPGDVITVWVNRDTGALTPPPITWQDAAGRAMLAAVLTALAGACIAPGVRRLVVRQASRRQARTLDAQWARIAPNWQRRYL
jgi:hypothetical protein